MNTPANGSQPGSDTDLPAMRPIPPSPAEPTAPDSGPTPVSVPYPRSGNRAEDTKRKRAELASREKLIAAGFRLKQRVSHPDGGDSTVEEILLQEASQRADIDKEAAEGSRKHHRFQRWIQSIPRYVLGFDFGLLLYFFAGITDVNWGNPVSLALAFAIVLAGMVDLLSYGLFTFTGHRLRSHKNDAGTVHREDLDGATSAMVVVSVVVIGVLAALMFLRIRTEVLYALGTQAQITALIIAIVVAVVNAAANILVIAIHTLDGSPQTARLDKLSAAIRRPMAEAHRLREQAAKQVNQ